MLCGPKYEGALTQSQTTTGRPKTQKCETCCPLRLALPLSRTPDRKPTLPHTQSHLGTREAENRPNDADRVNLTVCVRCHCVCVRREVF